MIVRYSWQYFRITVSTWTCMAVRCIMTDGKQRRCKKRRCGEGQTVRSSSGHMVPIPRHHQHDSTANKNTFGPLNLVLTGGGGMGPCHGGALHSTLGLNPIVMQPQSAHSACNGVNWQRSRHCDTFQSALRRRPCNLQNHARERSKCTCSKHIGMWPAMVNVREMVGDVMVTLW